MDYKSIMDEFEERFNGKEDGMVEICDGVSEERFNGKEDVTVETSDGDNEVRKRFLGVSKKGNKWRARIRHPKLKVKVHLGYYNSPEEAALVVKKKKAEFAEMFKGEDCSSMKTCRDEFERKKLPSGVRREYGKYRVRIWHPELKRYASFGSYNTCEEAVIVADKKKAELQEKYDCANNEVLPEAESEVASMSECLNKQTGDVKVPAGVRRIKSGKWVATIKDPMSNARIWIGTYNTAEGAIRSFNKRKALLASKTKRVGVVLDGCSTSLIGADNLNSIALDDNSNCEVVGVPDKPENSNSLYVNDERVIGEKSQGKTTCALDSDKAVGFGIINEYRQLLGKDDVTVETCDGVSEERFNGKEDVMAEICDSVSEERFNGKEDVTVETCDGVSEERFNGKENVTVEICDGVSDERFNGKEGVEIEICDDVSDVRKQFLGVSKKGNKWRARILHPQLKVKVHLGYYSSPEEAALVVKKKKVEFEETYKGEDSSCMKTCRGEFEGRKLPSGVRREYGKYRVRIWHPELKKYASFGSYNTCEEAAIVADKKRAELQVVPKVTRDFEDNDEENDKVLHELEIEQTDDVKVPAGVRRIRTGKWVARIKDPVSKDRIWLGTYNTAEGAIRSFNKEKAVLTAKTKRAEVDGFPTSLQGGDRLKRIALDDKSNCEVVDVPDKPENSNSSYVSDERMIGKESHPKTLCFGLR